MDLNDCVPWWGSMRPDGYGTVSVHSRNVKAHRFIYEETIGPIPAGHDVHHVCENRGCVNPAHLQALTRGAHIETHGSLFKARAVVFRNRAERTHCKHGHPFTPENMYRHKGKRVCRTCTLRLQREYQQRKKERAQWT